MRREVLRAEDISARIKKMIEEETEFLTNHPESTSEMYETVLTESFPFDDKILDKLFDSPSDKFQAELQKAAMNLYKDQEKLFTTENMRKVERDIFLQVLDNLWMQHLENMDHLREGIHWISVGQRDPLVEYRRQGGRIFDEMQAELRHEIVRAIAHAQPVDASDQVVETELTRAARGSIDNASRITQAEEFDAGDFTSEAKEQAEEAKAHAKLKKARKAERQRKKKNSAKKKKRK
jgi:preprotein translocase subunit SecA